MFQDAVQSVTGRPLAAGAGRRLGARLVDAAVAVVLGIVLTVLVIIGTFTFGDDLGLTNETLATLGDVVLLLVIVCVMVGPFLISALVAMAAAVFGKGTGTTPGRRAFGLQVVDADDGQPSRGRAALHGLLRHLPTALLFFAFLSVGFDGQPLLALAAAGAVLLVVDVGATLIRNDHRALHDVVAGVTVARRAATPKTD
jgi:uncharacterized RDD family membrane protein YckC